MMRRVICFILVLAFCLSLACTAFAATAAPSAGDSGRPSQTPDGGGTGGAGGSGSGHHHYDSNGSPKTGDVIMRWVLVMIIALIALAVLVVVYRKFVR